MQGVMVVSGRRGMGYIRGLGQPAGPFMPAAPPVGPDNSHVFTVEELSKIGESSLESALEAYKFFTRAAALREKAAFMSEILLNIESTPAIKKFLLNTEDGRNYYGALVAAKSLFLSLSQPNVTANIRIVAGMIEINTLRNRYGKGVRGKVPMYRNGASELSYSVTDTSKDARVKSTFDFGDLTKTSMLDDINVMSETAKTINPKVKVLGDPLSLGVVITIIVGSLIGLGIVYAMVAKFVDGKQLQIPPTPPPGVDPGAWLLWMKKYNESEKTMGQQIQDILTLLIVGGVVVTVAGAAYYIATRD